MYHGIILDKEFKDPHFVSTFRIFNKRKSRDADWMLYGIEVKDEKLSRVINSIQDNLKDSEHYYAHLYNGEKLIVIFKKKVFYATVNKSTWTELTNYGLNLGIPKVQLNVAPVRFEEEGEYFS